MMKEDLFDIIKLKSYNELTSEERSEIAELAENEVAYDNLKKFMLDVDGVTSDQIQPSESVKADLNELFDQVHGGRRYAWYMSFAAIVVPKEKPLHKQPLLYAAAILLIALLVVPISNINLNDTRPVIAQQEVVNEEVMPVEEFVENEAEVPISTDVNTRSVAEQPKSEVVLKDAEDLSNDQFETYTLTKEESVAEEEMVVSDLMFSAPATSVTAIPTTTGIAHPDGVFDNWAQESNFSIPASKQPEILDLLTTTF